jgi:acyl-CoA hydrolase
MPIDWKSRAVSATDVVSVARNGTNVFLHGACAPPTPLIEALCARRALSEVRSHPLHTSGPAPFVAHGREREFRSGSLFTGAPLGQAIAEKRADFVPIFLSDRGEALISIAHLDFRSELQRDLTQAGTFPARVAA